MFENFDDHLGPEVIAAYVDGELGSCATRRVCEHLSRCSDCRLEVSHQRETSQALQHLNLVSEVHVPDDLVGRIMALPVGQRGCGRYPRRVPLEELVEEFFGSRRR